VTKYPDSRKIRKVAGWVRLAAKGLDFVIRNPQEVFRLPRWFRERSATTTTLRSPWWPYSAIEWLASALPEGARVFEYGSGGSTLWLEDRGATVTVVEHDERWHGELAGKLGPTTRLLLQPATATGHITSEAAPGYFDDYIAAIDSQADGSLDLVIVDGRARVQCVRRALQKVKPGGLLMLDDTDRARYRSAVEMLSDWERHVFAGLKPGHKYPAQTSAWRRPSARA
jgi:hypothetical protein